MYFDSCVGYAIDAWDIWWGDSSPDESELTNCPNRLLTDDMYLSSPPTYPPYTIPARPARPDAQPEELEVGIAVAPNPFNPTTTITYTVDQPGLVSLMVYNTSGQLVRNLVSNAPTEPGARSVVWNGCDDSGRSVASGVYLVRMAMPGRMVSQRMTLVR